MGEEFQRIAFGPVGVRKGEKIAAFGGAGIVDQDVEATEALVDGRDERGSRVLFAEVDGLVFRLAAVLFDARRHLAQRGLVASGQHHVAALLRQRERHAAPDAAARAGHQRDLSGQSKVHADLAPEGK
jgi:hypothetical protein